MAENTAQPAQPSIIDRIGGFLGSVGKIFDNGVQVYASAKSRLNALEQIDNETVKEQTTAVKVPSADQQLPVLNKNNLFLIGGAIALLVLGVIIARKAR